MILRDYQKSASDAVKTWVKYKKEPCIISLPTGSGKTIVIRDLTEHFHAQGKRVCILAHRKKLIEQAAEKFDPLFPYSIYAASLTKGDINAPVVIASINTIYNKSCNPFSVIIADECHRIGNNQDEGMYWQFIKSHPQAALIGLSATPYRLQGGSLGWGDIVHEVPYNVLFERGYLCPLTNKATGNPNLANVSISLGDYKEDELEAVMVDAELVRASIAKLMQYQPDRESIMIFCVSIAHCEVVKSVMEANGLQRIGMTHSKAADGDAQIKAFKRGELRYLISCETLLEGFDAPNVDMILCLRPTKSKGLWEQMLGRGCRIAEGKTDCLLLDMAGNLGEHGGIGTPYKEPARKERQGAKGRICPECETWHEKATIRECGDCGFQFPEPEAPKVAHSYEPDMTSGAVYAPQPPVTYTVKDVGYYKHTQRATGKISLRIEYYCDTHYGKISEWLSPHNESAWARENCRAFFLERNVKLVGDLREIEMDELVRMASYAKMPAQIVVDHSEKYARIKKYIWEVKVPEPEKPLEEVLEDEIPF